MIQNNLMNHSSKGHNYMHALYYMYLDDMLYVVCKWDILLPG